MNNENKGIHPTGVSSRVWIALVALCVASVAELACADSHALGRERRRRRLGS